MIQSLRKTLGRQTDLLLVVGMIGILVVLFSPIPPRVLDFLLLINLSMALLILLLTFYVEKPVEFSTYPSLLLIATLFRLSLNIAAKVLQSLLREKVSIRHLEAVLEVLADAGRSTKDADRLTEIVRQRLGASICQALISSAGDLPVITLDPGIEQRIAGSIQSANEASRMLLEPKFAEMVVGRLAGQVEQMMKSNVSPVLLCAPELRRHVRSITERVLPHLAILSMAEVPPTLNLRSFGVVKL